MLAFSSTCPWVRFLLKLSKTSSAWICSPVSSPRTRKEQLSSRRSTQSPRVPSPWLGWITSQFRVLPLWGMHVQIIQTWVTPKKKSDAVARKKVGGS